MGPVEENEVLSKSPQRDCYEARKATNAQLRVFRGRMEDASSPRLTDILLRFAGKSVRNGTVNTRDDTSAFVDLLWSSFSTKTTVLQGFLEKEDSIKS